MSAPLSRGSGAEIVQSRLASRKLPSESEYQPYATWLATLSFDLNEFETRAKDFELKAQELLMEAEKGALAASNLFGSNGVGKNGGGLRCLFVVVCCFFQLFSLFFFSDFALVRSASIKYKENSDQLNKLISSLRADLSELQACVDERTTLKRAMEEKKTKTETISEDKDKVLADFDAANKAEDA